MRKCSATGPAEGQLKILLQNSVCFSRKWRLFLAHRFAAAKLGAAWLLACGKPTTLFSIGSPAARLERAAQSVQELRAAHNLEK
jgi:hypothetical protein